MITQNDCLKVEHSLQIRHKENECVSIDIALNKYIEAIKKDYLRSAHPIREKNSLADQVRSQMIVKFFNGLKYKMGSMYIKVISGSSVHSFIVREDGPKFKKGDILKAATWRAPALNQARGNIFGQYHINWTGADYLR